MLRSSGGRIMGLLVWCATTGFLECPVTFVVEDPRLPPVAMARLVFSVDYAPSELTFVGSGSSVDCVSLAGSATAVFSDDDAGTLRAEFTSATGLSSLIQPLARCTTASSAVPDSADLDVTILDERTLSGADVSPPVPVQVLLPSIDECDGSTETSTTTTLPGMLPSCADPTGDSMTTATDALWALNAAVGLVACGVCVCDVDGSGKVSASDSLIMLSLAVGQPFELSCTVCP